MNKIERVFLIVEGQDNSYPNHESANVCISIDDPSTISFNSPIVCSPIFSLSEEGVADLPNIKSPLKVSFIITPNSFPAFNYIKETFDWTNELWFSLGLSNLIIIEDKDSILADNIINHLKETNNITAFETWQIHEGKVVNEETRRFQFIDPKDKAVHIKLRLSDKLPNYLNFAVSEYIMSVNKFLTASRKFTPNYFEKHMATINASMLFVHDLCFLFGDSDFTPSDALLGTLGVTTKEDAIGRILDPTLIKQKEELINVKHAMIVQFNSSMSYIYTQAYSGTFPLFDHHGIVKRYSLLGIGTAISALFELIIQIEQAVFSVPFESLTSTKYTEEKIKSIDYFNHFIEPSPFDTETWADDTVRAEVVGQPITKVIPSNEDGFFHRLSFFSGRLGFREHEFCATSAIQVLVDAHSLRWNIINYSHEIIHNHVRIVLNNLLIPQASVNDISYSLWVDNFRSYLKKVLMENASGKFPAFTYKDYFTLCLFNFAALSNYYGSLNRPCNYSEIQKIRSNTSQKKKTDLRLVDRDELKELLQNVHRDITEIFVHVIDFCYIYNKRLETYLTSIWLSWSTIPSVAINLRQYIIRSLIIIALDENGTSAKRFESSLLKFRKVLDAVAQKGIQSSIISTIINIINDETEKRDLKFRFYNCIIVGDLVYKFLVGKMEGVFNNDDENLLDKDQIDEEGNPISYSIRTNSFEGRHIRSKVRFLIDQLEKEISRSHIEVTNATSERISAWLLLSLASQNN